MIIAPSIVSANSIVLFFWLRRHNFGYVEYRNICRIIGGWIILRDVWKFIDFTDCLERSRIYCHSLFPPPAQHQLVGVFFPKIVLLNGFSPLASHHVRYSWYKLFIDSVFIPWRNMINYRNLVVVHVLHFCARNILWTPNLRILRLSR